MTSRLIDLAVRRGELKARIEMQRGALALHAQPLVAALAKGDQVLAGVDWLKRHPGAVGAAVAALVVLKPRRAWRWARRGLVIWQSWRSLRHRFHPGVG